MKTELDLSNLYLLLNLFSQKLWFYMERFVTVFSTASAMQSFPVSLGRNAIFF